MAAGAIVSLLPVVGHAELQDRLATAARLGRIPQSLLFRGLPGVGKQRLALWLAALVQCRAEADRPCGSCTSCRLSAGLQHPDIHWFFPLPSPKGVSGDRRRQKLEEARLEELEARRSNPLWPTVADESVSIFLPMVEEIRAKAVQRPAMGPSAVFVIGDAERMVPQASSPEAANAFLKLLEEPPPDTLVFLTSSRPGALLPTIRSRVLQVRVTAPVPDAARDFLVEHAGMSGEEAASALRRFEGSIGTVLAARDEDGEDPSREAEALLTCAIRGSRADRFRFAAGYPSAGARGAFSGMLEALERTLRDAASVAAGVPEAALDGEAAARMGAFRDLAPDRLAGAVRHVEAAREAAAGNGNPQSIVAVLLVELAGALAGSGSARSAVAGTSRN
jgi:DNA polymerase-3 subunit delta'